MGELPRFSRARKRPFQSEAFAQEVTSTRLWRTADFGGSKIENFQNAIFGKNGNEWHQRKGGDKDDELRWRKWGDEARPRDAATVKAMPLLLPGGPAEKSLDYLLQVAPKSVAFRNFVSRFSACDKNSWTPDSLIAIVDSPNKLCMTSTSYQ